jgi:hypothetical protein
LEFVLWIRAFGDRVRSGRTSNIHVGSVISSNASISFPLYTRVESSLSKPHHVHLRSWELESRLDEERREQHSELIETPKRDLNLRRPAALKSVVEL